jgi:integrase
MSNSQKIATVDPKERWLSQIGSHTVKTYRPIFEAYLGWCHSADPKETMQSLLIKARDINWLEDHLRAWYLFKKGQGVEHSTRKNALNAVRSFYTHNNVLLPRWPREWVQQLSKEPERTYTKEEISKMLKFAGCMRDEALLLSLNGDPQRIEVYRAMTWGMVSEQITRNGIAIVNIPALLPDADGINCNKNATKYRFALLSEATAKIRQMMFERKNLGEKLTASSWLFRGYSIMHSRNPVRLPPDSDSTPLTNRAIEMITGKMAVDAGIQEYYKTAKVTKAVFHPHGFRRSFKARVREVWRKLKVPMDSDFLKFVIGDKLDYEGAYDKFSESLLCDIFTELEPYLSITNDFEHKQNEPSDLTVKTAKSGLLYKLFLELKDMYKSEQIGGSG